MSFVDESHTQWHRIYGKYATCPLDCGSGEAVAAAFQDDAEALVESGRRGIICGSCKGRHAYVATVKFCYEVEADAKTFERNEAAMMAELAAAGECEHGLNAALCVGLSHYPADF